MKYTFKSTNMCAFFEHFPRTMLNSRLITRCLFAYLLLGSYLKGNFKMMHPACRSLSSAAVERSNFY
jgi:hypothetical protein